MACYYAIERSPEYLMHYGVKGMKWGVRRAIKRGDKKALAKHYNKALKKYEKLIGKADLAKASNNANAHRFIGRMMGGFTGAQAGLSAALLATEGVKAWPLATFATAPMAIPAGIAGVNYGINKRRMTSKGHNKAVNKVKEWESEVDKAFKGTPHEGMMDSKKFKDEYSITELQKGKDGHYREKTIARIPGSHLATDYTGKDKQKFLKTAGQVPTVDSKRSIRSFSGIRRMNYNDGSRYNSGSEFKDPMAFNYNYRSLTRKRKDKKLPWYHSSTSAYREYKSG